MAQACAAATAPVLPTPRSVSQAKRSEERLQWSLASDAEVQSFLGHGVWEDTGFALPAGKEALRSHMVLDRVMGGTRRGLFPEATTSSRRGLQRDH